MRAIFFPDDQVTFDLIPSQVQLDFTFTSRTESRWRNKKEGISKTFTLSMNGI